MPKRGIPSPIKQFGIDAVNAAAYGLLLAIYGTLVGLGRLRQIVVGEKPQSKEEWQRS